MRLSVPTTSTPTSSKPMVIQATRYQTRPGRDERDGRHDVDDGGEADSV